MSSPPTVQFDAMAYAKSFIIGAVTAAAFYKIIDVADMSDVIPSGVPTAFVAGGVGALAGPYIMTMLPAGLQG